MSLSTALGKIGLQPYEAEVYLALLRTGRTTAGPVIRSTKFHRQVVYTALDRLSERGLVSYVVQNNRKQFSALPPEDLLRREVDRFREFTAAVPQLKALQKNSGSQLHVETFIGPNELIQSLLSATDSAARTDSLLRIIGGERATQLYGFMGSRYSEYVQYVADRGVSKRLITSAAGFEQYRDRFLREPRAQLRFHALGFSMPTYSIITQELMDLCVIGEEVLVLRIWNKAIARSYIEHFDILWKLGEPVKKRKAPTPRGSRRCTMA